MLNSIFIILVALFFTGCHFKDKYNIPTLQTVPYVDLNRYMGVWYEIARYPNKFQEGCVGTRAIYTLREDGKVSVLNECYDGSFEGKLKSAKGVARVVDPTSNAKLKVSFFWPFYGDYWIIDLGKDYEYAVVGHPKRKYLWILSRTKKIDQSLYEEILDRIREKNYDTTRLLKTLQR